MDDYEDPRVRRLRKRIMPTPPTPPASDDSINITKGTHIRAAWMQVNDPLSCLAGAQMKLGVTSYAVSGIVRHVRGDHPTNPTEIRFYIDPDGDWKGPTTNPPGCTCGKPHVEVKPKHVVEVL